jgi:copper chaperone CopZ
MNRMPILSATDSNARYTTPVGHFLFLLAFALLGVMPLNACHNANAQGGWETAEIQTSAVCNTCKMTLTKAFKDVEGVKWSRLDLGNKVMTIKYDPETIGLEDLRTIIVKTGYDADGETGDPEAHDALPYCCQKDSGMH